MHVRVMFFLVFHQQIGPQVVLRYRKATDIDNVAAFATHPLGHMLHVFSSELLVIDYLHIPVGARLPGRFVGQYHDAGVTGFFEYRLQHVGIVRHDSDGIHFTCNQVLNNFHLLRRIGAGRPYLGGVEVKLFPGLDYPFTHPVKPWHAVHF